MDDTLLSAVVFFSPRCRMGLDGVGFVGHTLGQLPRLLPHLLEKGLEISSGPGRVQLCWINVMMMSWVCRM